MACGSNGRYYACLEKEQESDSSYLCAWETEQSANAATVGEASKECVTTLDLGRSGRVRELVAVDGGALVVTTTGEVQLFGMSAEHIDKARTSGELGSRRVETVSVLPESVGALVVTTDGNFQGRKIATFLARAQTVTLAWELDIEHPDGAAKARVASAASDGETFMVLWDDGVWALHDASDGSLKHKLRLDGLDVHCDEATSGKRSKKSEDTSPLASAASLCLSQDYYAVVANSKEENTVIVAVFDSRYGAVHLAEDISRGLEHKVGRTSGVSLAATSGNLVVGLSDQVVSVQFDLPELSLASLVGSLSIHSQPEASAAAIRVLGAEIASTALVPPQHAAVTPGWKLEELKLDGQGVVSLSNVWDDDDAQTREKKVRSTAEALASGSKKAGSSLQTLMKSLPIPQILIESAISGGLNHRVWDSVTLLLAGGHIRGSSTARQLVTALLEEDMLDEVKDFLVYAKDVSAEDIVAILHSAMMRDEDDPGLKKRASANKKLAEKVLDEAEACASDEKFNGEAKQELFARAQLLVSAYDSFAPWAQQLHPLIARPLDPTMGMLVLRDLSKQDAVSLLQYLLVWANFYASSGGYFARINTLVEPGIPSAHAVVTWTSALLDAQFTTFCLSDDVAEPVRALRESSSQMLDMMRSLAALGGAFRHVGENSPLPEQHGVQSTTYTVESVAW